MIDIDDARAVVAGLCHAIADGDNVTIDQVLEVDETGHVPLTGPLVVALLRELVTFAKTLMLTVDALLTEDDAAAVVRAALRVDADTPPADRLHAIVRGAFDQIERLSVMAEVRAQVDGL